MDIRYWTSDDVNRHHIMGCGECQVRFSSGALQNKYHATKKRLESGLLYNETIEHNIEGHMESPN